MSNLIDKHGKLPKISRRTYDQVAQDILDLSDLIDAGLLKCEEQIDITSIAKRYCFDPKGWEYMVQLIKMAGYYVSGDLDSDQVFLHTTRYAA